MKSNNWSKSTHLPHSHDGLFQVRIIVRVALMQTNFQVSSILAAIGAALFFLVGQSPARSESLGTNFRSSPEAAHCSSWLDFGPRAIKSGKEIWIKLRPSVGKRVRQIYVRLLEVGANAGDDKIGLGIHDVHAVGEHIKIPVIEDHENIRQLSVHGGDNPFATQVLVPGNGCPILESAQLMP